MLGVGACMRKPHSALIFFVLLVFGLSLAVPAEDVLETAYDESEAAPYASTPLCSNLISEAAASVTGAVRGPVDLRSDTPRRLAVTRFTGIDRHRLAEARVTLALLCTLLC